MKLSRDIAEYAEMVKLGHTLFALPYALAGFCLAVFSGFDFSAAKLFWVASAFFGARSAAMGFNRIADAEIDAQNPRTKNRALAAGRISKKSAWGFVAASALLMVFSAAMLNKLCFYLSFPAIAVLFGYSYCKRFTSLSHIVLGAALSLAPIGAWCALAGVFEKKILFLGLALMFQIAAFDILYALQDEEFDKSKNLHSIPALLGRKKSVATSAAFLAISLALLYFCAEAFSLGAYFYAGFAVVAMLYFAAIFIFAKSGTKKIDLVFFYINASCSFLTLVSIFAGGYFL
ncbi:MAG: putative 4-hydroxybenzoate polyprenyltransferase [Opitutales bacterium]|nr:putative 4-hydroxybenzoate polyprenyltransferase [Opitutales bacterium]